MWNACAFSAGAYALKQGKSPMPNQRFFAAERHRALCFCSERRPDGFTPITGIVDAKQLDYLSRESISRESSDLQRLISRRKMGKDGLRVVLLENRRFCFFKGVALQGFLGFKQGFKSNISLMKIHPNPRLITIHFCCTPLAILLPGVGTLS